MELVELLKVTGPGSVSLCIREASSRVLLDSQHSFRRTENSNSLVAASLVVIEVLVGYGVVWTKSHQLSGGPS